MDTSHDRLEHCRSIAVLGGTFDPIHHGHLAVAQAVLEAFGPNRVLFVPVGKPPHKHTPAASFEHRYAMAQLAVAAHPSFDVSRMEEERGGTSYTVDTLKALRKMCAADVRIDFVLGADALAQIESWKNADELLSLCRLVVVGRDGYEIHAKRLRKKYNAQIEVLDINTPPVSGTAIRKRVAEGKPIRFLLPREAEDYIRRHGLYGCPPFSFERARQALSLTLSPRRFEHTLGVVEEAERLAVLYHADVDKARIAALLHDCAKEYSPAKKRTLCALWHIPLCETLSEQIDLTHGLLGAEAARRDFGVYDEEILQAIRFHIAGHKDLTLLDKIILLADFIEPTREDYPGLTQIRGLAYTDIKAAILCGLRVVMQDNFERKRLIHPWSMDAVNTLEGQMNGK